MILRCAQRRSPEANEKFEQGAKRLFTAHTSVRLTHYSSRSTVNPVYPLKDCINFESV